MAIDGIPNRFTTVSPQDPDHFPRRQSPYGRFTYSNWYGYGKHEPEKQKYIDENGVQQKEWVQDTNYFYPAFFMEFYP